MSSPLGALHLLSTYCMPGRAGEDFKNAVMRAQGVLRRLATAFCSIATTVLQVECFPPGLWVNSQAQRGSAACPRSHSLQGGAWIRNPPSLPAVPQAACEAPRCTQDWFPPRVVWPREGGLIRKPSEGLHGDGCGGSHGREERSERAGLGRSLENFHLLLGSSVMAWGPGPRGGGCLKREGGRPVVPCARSVCAQIGHLCLPTPCLRIRAPGRRGSLL